MRYSEFKAIKEMEDQLGGGPDPDHTDNIDNVGKVQSDDPYNNVMVNPLQQDLELRKKDAGKDIENHEHIYQSANSKGPHIVHDGPLVTEPEEMDGEKPGLSVDMRKEIENSPNAQNIGQWSDEQKEAPKDVEKYEPTKPNTTWDVKDSETTLGADTEKRVSDAEAIRATLDKIGMDKLNKEREAAAGATALTTKSGIPAGFGQQ